MKSETPEVCIIGAGIAGSTLAYNLAPDFDVCLVEKKPLAELGRKPCGNAVHRAWLQHDGVEPDPEDFDAITSVSRSIVLHLPGGDFSADLSPERELLILDRKKMIKELVGAAMDRGCDFIESRARPSVKGKKVRGIETENGKIEAETYVDASGATAVLRRNFALNPPNSLFPGYREIVDYELDDGVSHVLQTDPSHALWAFPMGERVNIGVAAFREDGVNFEREAGKLKRELGIDGEVLDSGSGPIPSSEPIDMVYGNSVAIGDAGFTANPLTGGGIGPSISAANLLTDTLQEGGELKEFQRRYMEEVGSGYKRNYYLSRLLLGLQKFMWVRVASWAMERFYGGRPVEE